MQLESLSALVGTWDIEARHPAFPDTVVRGQSVFEWFDGEKFLVQRSHTDHPDFPNSLSVIGEGEERLAMHYFDSRGVQRVYQVVMGDGVWTMWRDAPGFSQRFTGRIGDGGGTISGLWQLSKDGFHWADDLAITFRRA